MRRLHSVSGGAIRAVAPYVKISAEAYANQTRRRVFYEPSVGFDRISGARNCPASCVVLGRMPLGGQSRASAANGTDPALAEPRRPCPTCGAHAIVVGQPTDTTDLL